MTKTTHRNRSFLPLLHDVLMAGLSLFFALYLRLGEDRLEIFTPYWAQASVLFAVLAGVIFALFRLYRGLWRYTSLHDLIRIGQAAAVSIATFMLLLFLVFRLEGFPRSIFAIQWILLVLMLGMPRFLFRYIAEGGLSADWKRRDGMQRIPVLIIGMNDQTEHFLRQMERSAQADYRVVGILGEDPSLRGRNVRGVRVYGNRTILPKVLNKLKRQNNAPQKLLLADDHLIGQELQVLLNIAESEGLTVARLPRITDLKQTDSGKLTLRPMRVEDLLGRHQLAQDLQQVRQMLQGARVLVTGAGGTIGSELVRQIAACSPVHLLLVESSEHNLYLIDQELGRIAPGVPRHALIADVRDRQRMEHVFSDYQPEIVFHAAALKHVPLSEMNVEEAVMTNVFGTKHIADLSLEHNVKAMVLISTDKAVNPTNIMGATKRVAEKYCQSLGQLVNASRTKFVTVRFGNVLGSSGSVIPLFYKQLEMGGPLTVTDPNMTRYFMTVREAVELVLQAATLSLFEHSNEKSMIYVLDMGEPVKIVDLATQMIRLAGLEPEKDIRIVFTGIRPGEKLYEELFYREEAPSPTPCPGVMLSSPLRVAFVEVDNYLRKLHKAVERRDTKNLLQSIRHLVPEYEV